MEIMSTKPGSTRPVKRPALVWLISSFYISAGLWALLAYYQMSSGLAPLPPSILAHFADYSEFDYQLLMSVAALNVIAGVLFLLLRRESVYVFAFKFVAGVLLTVWDALTKGGMDASSAEYMIVALMLWSASAAVCFYAWHLMRKGVLR